MHIVDRFIKFEEDKQLFHLSVHNVQYWSAIRFNIYNTIYQKEFSTDSNHPSHNKKNSLKKIGVIFNQFGNFFFRNPFFFLQEREMLVLNHARRVPNNKNDECIYTDSLLKNSERSYYVFEEPYFGKHFKNADTENLRYFDYLNLKTSVYKLFLKRINKYELTKEQVQEIKNLVTDINLEFQISINYKTILDLVSNYVLTYYASYNYYLKIINKINPKIIVEVVSYSKSRYIINEIAKKKGIKVIELQHGTMGKYHISYNFESKRKLDTFPDYIFLFGQFWKDNTRFPIEDSRVKVVGWPYYEKKINNAIIKNKCRQKKIILFISQGLIGKRLSKVALEVEERSNSEDFQVIYKLHPSEYLNWKKEYPWLVDSKIEVVDNNNFDMHYYFSQADIQVGVSSTAIFEGLGYGLVTMILKFPSYEYFEELFSNKTAKLVKNAEELMQFMHQETYLEADQKNYFWQNSSEKNINYFLNKITEDKGE